ncbi:hypothetical protein AAFF_G00382480 [Aldrovandia affinis]|uniref:Endonuclease/exonuclease/phosphatase domain-containing protein n=1 Tax=Aldrovandia affinis TaxID=143900 RepID=A0AAD7T9W2_9TELE|nr:hypothetical protein AAFF_G00382480 [Aldrovandia affinis]
MPEVKVLSAFCTTELDWTMMAATWASVCTACVSCEPLHQQANAHSAQQQLANQIMEVEQKYPDSPVIIVGDFNHTNLSVELPKYKQLIKCLTRERNTLDHCYSTIKDAYQANIRAPLGNSDHSLIHLIPSYRQKLKAAKPVEKSVRTWSTEAIENPRGCLDSTDWDIFKTNNNNLDDYADAVTSYISFCEETCIPTRAVYKFNNCKPWFFAELGKLRTNKEEAYRPGCI